MAARVVAVAAACFVAGPRTAAAYLFFGCVFAMAANAVIPHALATVAQRRRMPGTATGLALNLPLGIWLIARRLDGAWVEGSVLLWVAPATAIGLVALIPALFALGRRARALWT